MKEMIYCANPKIELLYSGNYLGYDFYIVSLGTHPVAYVDVSNNSKLFGMSYFALDIEVHGGLTFSNNTLYLENETKKGWLIGWDYCHAEDCFGYISFEGKKWTTEEIYEDVKSVIKQILEKYSDEEKTEWEDLKKLKTYDNIILYDEFSIKVHRLIINKLIKNQKYLKNKIEQLEKRLKEGN